MICNICQYCASDQTKKNEMVGACSTYGESRGVDRVLVGKLGEKRPYGRERRRLEGNNKTGL
jgi:hypothetical protein